MARKSVAVGDIIEMDRGKLFSDIVQTEKEYEKGSAKNRRRR